MAWCCTIAGHGPYVFFFLAENHAVVFFFVFHGCYGLACVEQVTGLAIGRAISLLLFCF